MSSWHLPALLTPSPPQTYPCGAGDAPQQRQCLVKLAWSRGELHLQGRAQWGAAMASKGPTTPMHPKPPPSPPEPPNSPIRADRGSWQPRRRLQPHKRCLRRSRHSGHALPCIQKGPKKKPQTQKQTPFWPLLAFPCGVFIVGMDGISHFGASRVHLWALHPSPRLGFSLPALHGFRGTRGHMVSGASHPVATAALIPLGLGREGGELRRPTALPQNGGVFLGPSVGSPRCGFTTAVCVTSCRLPPAASSPCAPFPN